MKDVTRSEKKLKNIGKRSQQVPLWLRRLDLVKAEMKTVQFPRTVAEGFRQCAELSETARRWFVDSIRQDHPGASEEEIEQERRLLLARFSAAQERWIKKWKKECDRYFRGKSPNLKEDNKGKRYLQQEKK